MADWYGRSATEAKPRSGRAGGVGGVHRDMAEAPQSGLGSDSAEWGPGETGGEADELGRDLESWEVGLEEEHAREAMVGEEREAGLLRRARQMLGADKGSGGESPGSGGAEDEAGVAGMEDGAGAEERTEREVGGTDGSGWPEPVGGEWAVSAGSDLEGMDGHGADPLTADVGVPGEAGVAPGAELVGGETLTGDPWSVSGVAGAGPVDPLNDPLGDWGADEPEPGW